MGKCKGDLDSLCTGKWPVYLNTLALFKVAFLSNPQLPSDQIVSLAKGIVDRLSVLLWDG